MKLIIEKEQSIILYHLSDILEPKYGLPFPLLLRLWDYTGKPSMIKFEQILKKTS